MQPALEVEMLLGVGVFVVRSWEMLCFNKDKRLKNGFGGLQRVVFHQQPEKDRFEQFIDVDVMPSWNQAKRC